MTAKTGLILLLLLEHAAVMHRIMPLLLTSVCLWGR